MGMRAGSLRRGEMPVSRVGRLVTVYVKVQDATIKETEGRTSWLQLYGEMFDEAPRIGHRTQGKTHGHRTQGGVTRGVG